MNFQYLLFLAGICRLVSAKVQFVGVNIAGFEFGCGIDGSCPLSQAQGPLTSLGGGDGQGQMQHFATDDQMNIFRLPVSWQFLTNNVLGGALDATNIAKYDQLMQACLNTGASCAIDLHNFSRFNGQIIGQSSGGPTDAQFADFWTQLATKYKSNTKVIFGLMNEPHDLDVPTWAATCQAVVTAIRNSGASNMILLPGTNFASAGRFVSSGSAAELIKIKNPDGTFDNLVLDLHKYLDVDNSGSHTTCTTDNIADAFQLAADFLRTNGRTALVSETGAGTDASCFTDFCAQNTFLNQNSDVFLGYIAWAAGSFATSYTLALTPTSQNGKYIDTALALQCVIAPWLSASASVPTTAPAGSATSAPGVTLTTVENDMSTAPAGSPTTTLTLTSTSSRVVGTITRTFSTTLLPLSATSTSSSSQTTPTSSPVGSSGYLAMGGTSSWTNGTAAATSATMSGSSESLSSPTSAVLPTIEASAAETRTPAKRLLIGSVMLALFL